MFILGFLSGVLVKLLFDVFVSKKYYTWLVEMGARYDKS